MPPKKIMTERRYGKRERNEPSQIRKNETEEMREKRLKYARECMRERLRNEMEEMREKRLKYAREYMRKRLKNETEERRGYTHEST